LIPLLRRTKRGLDERVINANRRHFLFSALHTHELPKLAVQPAPSFVTQSRPFVRVLARRKLVKSMTENRAQKPMHLPFFFHRASLHQGLRALF